jgi:hypothetical protein
MSLALIMGRNKEALTGSPLHVKHRDFPRAASDLFFLHPICSISELALNETRKVKVAYASAAL